MPRPTAKPVELSGTFEATRWRSPNEGDTYQVGFLDDGTAVCGNAPEGDLIPGVGYTFYGSWNTHARHGKQFKFSQYLKREPHSREGLVGYLRKFAPGVGPVIAGKLWDAFGSDAVTVLRSEPERAAEAVGPRLPVAKALEASAALKALAATEQTRIELLGLFAGRGFSGALVDLCIQQWGLLAPVRIKRDPFALLVHGFPSCGFARCDTLYLELGHNPARLKRQVICLWHLATSDTSGSTWLPADVLRQRLGEQVGAAKVKTKRAVQIGMRSGWLAVCHDEAGQVWIAEGKRARNEAYLAEKLLELVVAVNRMEVLA